MSELQSIKDEFKSELRKLPIILIILTLIQVFYIIISFTDKNLWINLDSEYGANWLILLLHFIVAELFLSFNWTKMPIDKERKTSNTFLILFLGIIGMWLWIPNKREIKKLTQQ